MEPVFESVDTFTPEEFARWVGEREFRGDLHHYEFLHGRIVMMTPAGWPHGSAEARLLMALGQYVVTRILGQVFGSSQGFALPSGDVVEPDVTFVSNERWAQASPREGEFLKVVPDLVMEILSQSTASRDRGEKKGIYERNGVREYWLADTRSRRISIFNLEGDRFGAPQVAEADEVARSRLLPGFEVRVADAFP
ncbi:MAG: Uma2 family endonuclease [Myxococcales bacterium]|nr:Uma2 family endonuclease [Myxococcales bacterium]